MMVFGAKYFSTFDYFLRYAQIYWLTELEEKQRYRIDYYVRCSEFGLIRNDRSTS
jgi:hypothetical protein